PTSSPRAPARRAPGADSTPRREGPPRSVMRTVGPAGLVIPVQGIAPESLQDTFNDARGQSRVHDAIDIMAPRGTPVLAVADGTVEKLFTSAAGGITLYQFEPDSRYVYYYAHLDRYAAGLEEGDTLRRGQVIGYVGSTGNASPDAPHLHFAIFLLGPEKRWWDGTAINPYPLLGGRRGWSGG
ncbi:M23 family metallopeptidase, partial [Lysobacter sp. A3-1-A15]